jgi:hypothetical protein
VKTGTQAGRSREAREWASTWGTMTIGLTHESRFKVGRVRASQGMPGLIESQVEQMLAKGLALRPELARVAIVVKLQEAEITLGVVEAI